MSSLSNYFLDCGRLHFIGYVSRELICPCPCGMNWGGCARDYRRRMEGRLASLQVWHALARVIGRQVRSRSIRRALRVGWVTGLLINSVFTMGYSLFLPVNMVGAVATRCYVWLLDELAHIVLIDGIVLGQDSCLEVWSRWADSDSWNSESHRILQSWWLLL